MKYDGIKTFKITDWNNFLEIKVVIDFDKTGNIIIAPTDISGSLDNYIEETANSLRVEIRK